MKKLVAIVVVALAASGAGSPKASTRRPARPDKSALAFEHEVGGQLATWDAEWKIFPRNQQLGKIVAAAVCDEEAFLLDRQFEIVHRIDLNQGTVVANIGQAAGADRLWSTASVAADCASRTLYVIDYSGVVVFNMDSGAITRRFSKPARFVASVGSAILESETQMLYVPGVWGSSDGNWLLRPLDQMFEGNALGYRLDLRTGHAAPMLAAVERGCWSRGPNCVYATLDKIHSSSGAKWVAAHRVGRLVGVYDADFRPIRAIDVRSRLFLETGVRNESTSVTEMVAWNEDNSVIRFCYGFGDSIVTVHSYNRTRGWRPGRQTDFNVFVNIHALDGTGLVSDLRLPDLPVGRDATSLYVIDYGVGGRRITGSDPISLLRIPTRHQ
jgi:hypothetical protein